MSLGSALVKYFVPTTVEKIFRTLSIVLGARHYLREGHWHGLFQKLARDNSILGLFDGSTIVNLNAIALQLPQLAVTRAKPIGHDDEKLRAQLAACFTLAEPLRDFDPAGLTLHNHGRDAIVQGLRISSERLTELKSKPEIDAEVLEAITRLTRHLIEEVGTQEAALQKILSRDSHMRGKSPELFDLAKNYSALFAGAACVHMWLHNRESFGDYFARGEWLALALERIHQRLGGHDNQGIEARYEVGAAAELERLHAEQRLFSFLPFQLAV